MGLETVELVMEVEEQFDIRISDAEAETVRTVGDLHALVCRLLMLEEPGKCLTRPMFYRIRRAFAHVAQVEARRFRPNVNVEHLLANPARRRKAWRELGGYLKLQLPSLEIHPVAAGMAGAFTFLSFASAFFGWTLAFTLDAELALPIWLGTAVGSGASALLIRLAARPFAATVPAECETVAGLTRYAVLRDPKQPAARARDVWSPTAVLEALRKIISKTLGVRPELIRPDADFFDDLGVLG
jgi:acyl carrier protein